MLVNAGEIFSKNLIRYRKLRGLSQRDLASRASLTQRMVNYYENNPKSIPVDKMEALSKALSISIADFFDDNKTSPLEELDVRWLKKLAEIKDLPESKQKEIVRNINTIVENYRLKQQK